MGLWVAGHSSVETIRDQLQRAIAAAGTPSGTLAGEEVRSIGDRSTQLASQDGAGLAVLSPEGRIPA